MSYEYRLEDIIDLIESKKVPLMVRHGIVAIWEGTYRVLKKTKTGKIWRTQERKDVYSRAVTRTKTGFLDAFNIITASFSDLGFIKARKDAIVMTADGKKQNSLHLRETDSRRRTMAFDRLYKKFFSSEITEYNKG